MSGTIYFVSPLSAALAFLAVACDGSARNEGTGPAPVEPALRVAQDEKKFTSKFRLDGCTFRTIGHNPFFPLVPGDRLVLEGESDGQPARLELTVRDETVRIGGIVTRVVEERHMEGGELVEVSRN